MAIAQLDVVGGTEYGVQSSDEVMGGLFVHDVWKKDVRQQSGLWRWEPKTRPLTMPSESPWARAGGVSGRWTINNAFIDLYMFQTKVAFLKWWGGDPVGSGIPRYPLQTGSIFVEDAWLPFDKSGRDHGNAWFNIVYRVSYVDSPNAIPWHLKYQ